MSQTLPPLKRIAAVHDLSGVGKCSLTVALPIISATGVECACMPTAVLSTHTGEFTGYTMRPLTDEMLPMAEHWRREGVRFQGIYSGYLASPAQAALLEEVLSILADEDTLVIIDPVMADHGRYYRGLDGRICQAFRRLCARADIITPNITEAAFLTGLSYRSGPHEASYLDELLSGLRELGPRYAALTGARPVSGGVGNLALDCKTGERYAALGPEREGVYYGGGDIFASALSALLVRGAELRPALETASSLVEESVARSLLRPERPRRFGMDFEGALPAYVRKVEALFAGSGK